MSLIVEYLLLGLRVLMVIALYAFLGVVLFYLVREHRTANEAALVAATLTEIRDPNPADGAMLRMPRTYKLSAESWIGRDPNCLIRINDSFASAQHARIVWVNELMAWRIEDNNSRNGTLVNSERVVRAMLKPNDVIRIGDAEFRFG